MKHHLTHLRLHLHFLLPLAVMLGGISASTHLLAQPTKNKGMPNQTAPAMPSMNALGAPDLCQLLRKEGGSSLSTVQPKRLPHDPRLVVFGYHKDQIYPIQTLANRFTHIEFESDELIESTVINDETEWEQRVLVSRSDLVIRSRLRGASGSLVVITSKRRYNFDLLDTSACPNETRYQRVSFTYSEGILEFPKQQVTSAAALPTRGGDTAQIAQTKGGAQSADFDLSMNVDLGKLYTDYSIEGDDALKPESVMDDGQRTWIKFRDQQALRPVLFAVGADGQAETVEYAPRGSYFVIGRVFEHGAKMVHGKREVLIRRRSSNCGFFDADCKNLKVKNIEGAR